MQTFLRPDGEQVEWDQLVEQLLSIRNRLDDCYHTYVPDIYALEQLAHDLDQVLKELGE